MYKNGIWKPQEPYDYFPQAQKVYIETVVKKKSSQIRCIQDQKLFAMRLAVFFKYINFFFFNPPDKYHMKD